jgi:hypothetical protein
MNAILSDCIIDRLDGSSFLKYKVSLAYGKLSLLVTIWIGHEME